MYCTQCGKNNLDNAKFCICCGAELSNVKTVNANPDNNISQGIQPSSIEMASPTGISGQFDIKPKKNILMPCLLGAAGLIIVVLVIVIIIVAGKSDDNNGKMADLSTGDNNVNEVKSDNSDKNRQADNIYQSVNDQNSSKDQALEDDKNKIKELIYQIEDETTVLCMDVYANAEKIVDLYKEFEKLSNDDRHEVANRDKLITANAEALQIIENRKSDAQYVDSVIAAIDTSNIYAKANDVSVAVGAYNAIDEYTRAYLTKADLLEKYYNEVCSMYYTVTKENFDQLFWISYSVGDKINSGGISIDPDGAYYYNEKKNKITPTYDITATNDYSVPVYVYIGQRYPEIYCECSFHINLHQTYTGLGFIDSDVHEFNYQSGDIYYNSDMGVAENVICVQNNDASDSLLSFFGYSYDFDDMLHSMNDFDVKAVEISQLDGHVMY